MSNDSLPDFITTLLRPEAYPHPVSEIKLIQTHISYVLLAGEFVYKIKKPVNFGFLDFTSLEKRQYFCGREVELNRRLCPDLYLGVSAITRAGAGFVLDGPDGVVEYAVKMARMDESRLMGRIIEAGQLEAATLDKIVEILVPFYEKAAGGSELAGFGTPDAVAVNVLENFAQTEGFVGCASLSVTQFQRISNYAQAFLERGELFGARIKAGRIRDCHGDLYSANICLTEPIRIFDCIEFNERFRYCDVASDVAFLAMDLDYHQLPELSRHFINRFVERSGDSGLPTMLDFYKCYRAYVRGKIGLFTAHAPEVDAATQAASLAQAGRYFQLAERYAGGA
jgi:aminoglycoside phosphotransferase family enzyme